LDNSIAIGTIQVINAGVKILGVVLRGLSAVLSGFASSPKTAEALMGSVGSGSSASYFTAFTDGVKRVWVAVPSEFWWVIMGMMAIGIVLGWVHNMRRVVVVSLVFVLIFLFGAGDVVYATGGWRVTGLLVPGSAAGAPYFPFNMPSTEWGLTVSEHIGGYAELMYKSAYRVGGNRWIPTAECQEWQCDEWGSWSYIFN